MKKLEVWFLKKSLRWTDRVRGVGDYHIVCGFVLSKELESIAYKDPDARGIE
jgi:hypothetical protein